MFPSNNHPTGLHFFFLGTKLHNPPTVRFLIGGMFQSVLSTSSGNSPWPGVVACLFGGRRQRVPVPSDGQGITIRSTFDLSYVAFTTIYLLTMALVFLLSPRRSGHRSPLCRRQLTSHLGESPWRSSRRRSVARGAPRVAVRSEN